MMHLFGRVLRLLVYPILKLLEPWYPALGQTDEPVVGAGHSRRPDTRTVGVGVGECVSAPASDRAEPRQETTATDEQRPAVVGAAGTAVARLESGLDDRPT